MEEEIRRRPFGPVVRVEVERAMPQAMRDLLQREFRFEESEQHSTLSAADFYEADGIVGLGALAELAPPRPTSDYRPVSPADPFPPGVPVCDALDRKDVLVHHPYDSFSTSFERWLDECADDPDVLAIKLTLYRPGGPSGILEARHRAAGAGKDVSVLVELKARCDEEHNIAWAGSLEQLGIHVVTGLVNLKTHAKVALVVRRRGGRIRRYAHVGTGNYNPDTARLYSDLGLFTADEELGTDLNLLFNELTGSPRPPHARLRPLAAAPAPTVAAAVRRRAGGTACTAARRPARADQPAGGPPPAAPTPGPPSGPGAAAAARECSPEPPPPPSAPPPGPPAPPPPPAPPATSRTT